MTGRWLFRLVIVLFVGLVTFYTVAITVLPSTSLRPGGTFEHLLAVVGALLLVATLSYSWVKRTGMWPGGVMVWQNAHVVLGAMGVWLVIFHSATRFGKVPALLVLGVLGIALIGVYGRFAAGPLHHLAFGSQPMAFMPVAPRGVPAFDALNARRASLARALDPEGDEAIFGLRIHHWLQHPVLAARFILSTFEERRLIGRELGGSLATSTFVQQYWRMAHIGLVLLLVAGLLAHVVATLFFAGYVAEGNEVYWWHLRQ